MTTKWSEEFNAARGKISLRRLQELAEIPRRTTEDWSAGKSEPPTWVKRLVIEYLKKINQ